MPYRTPLERWYHTPAFRLIARVLVVAMLAQSCPIGVLRPSPADAGEAILWVDRSGDCGGRAPCYRTIQTAIDAATAGQTVRVRPGEYVEQLRLERKNAGATSESDRIVIEADPEAPVGSVRVTGSRNRCPTGYALSFSRSKLITVRGLTFAGAGFRGVRLRGGSRRNQGIRLERNRLFTTPARCMGGINVGRGNADTVIANNVLQGLDRHALRFQHGESPNTLVVGNTIIRNGWNGIYLGRIADVRIWNNIIAFNGTARGGRGGGKFGIRRQKVTKPRAADVELRNNLLCGNTAGEFDGPALDANDADNVTPTGGEGPGVSARPGCDALAAVFAGLAGPDGVLDSADDVFDLAAGSPAIGAGLDPRAHGTSAPNAVFEADYLREGARPGDDRFDIGAIEGGGPLGQTPSPTPGGVPVTPSPTPPAVTPSPTATRTATVSGPVRTPTVTPAQTPDGTNRRPIATEDQYELEVATTLQVPASGVLANDADLDSDPLTATLVDPPLLGSLTAFNPDGSFVYEAPANFVQPALNPGVLWRIVTGTSGFGQVADFNRDGFPDLAFIEFGQVYGHDGRNGNRIFQVDLSDTTHVDVNGCSIGAAATSSMAVGDVDDSGDVSFVKPLACNGDSGSNRFVAINGSHITAGKVGPLWATENLSVPHPGAYANASDPAPANPPIRTQASAVERSHPSLARLTAAGGVKVLARKILRNIDGFYLGLLPNGTVGGRQAGCRAVTGLPADENQPCRITWIIDAATGAVENVLTAPNLPNDFNLPQDRPLSNNPPFTADLDGDGDVEIISGGDVFTQAGGVWTLAWQTKFEPLSVAVADLDGDGTLEVIQYQPNLFGRQAPESGIFIYAHDGTLVRRIPPVKDGQLLIGFLSVGDIDGDGVPEILFPAEGFLYAFRADGRLLWIFAIPDRPETLNGLVPAPVTVQFRTGETSAQVYDLDLDGRPEVIMHAGARLWILDGATGGEEWSMDTEGYGAGNRTLALADMDQDGHVDIVATGPTRWNCSVITGGPVPCLGNTLVVSGLDHNWAPGPKVFNQIPFSPSAVDDEAKILFAGTPRRDFRMAEQQGTVVDPRLREGTKFTYAAHDATDSSDTATVFLKIRPDNSPPVITSLPPTGLLSVTPYTRPIYQITATDPDPGDVLHYEIVSTTHFLGGKTETPVNGATGVSVDPDTGAVSFYTGPCGSFGGGCVLGDVIVVVAAIDSFGLRTEQGFLVTISASVATVPDVVGQLFDPAVASLQNAGLRARVIAEVFAAAPPGTVIGQTPVGGTINVALGTSVDLTMSKGPLPTPTPLPTASRTPDPNATVTPLPPIDAIVVEPSGQILAVGSTQQYAATAVFEDGTAADVTASAIWDSSAVAATVSSTGLATAAGAGTTTVSATLAGVTGGATLTVLAKVPSDFVEPVAEITAPTSDAEVTEPVDVIGTATDANFLRFELAIAPVGETTFTIIRTGDTEVSGGVLGQLDPTLLINDQYTLQLTVFDRNGNQTVASVTVQVSREMKVGHFTLAFNDVTVDAAGLPVAVVRAYDSRDKRSGDFGVGWHLDLQTIRVRANRVLGTGWVKLVSGAFVQLQPTDAHKVTVTLPNGRVEEFDLQIFPTGQIGSLDATNVVGFAKRPGTLGKLEALANPNLLVVSGGAEDVLVDDNNLEPYEPTQYRYTDLEGTQVEVDLELGVQKITDTNGNQLVIGPNGISHSAGKSLVFGRDAEDRIVQVTDPMGHEQHYTYDERGDLRTHSDALDNVTTFAYDRRHNLITIADPLGRPVARNEYDDDGRLVAVTDAKGNRITIAHDIAGRQEVVTDRLGRAQVLTYDDQGNVLARTNALGETTATTYDTRGNALTVTDPLGRTTTYAYDANNRPTSVTDPLGHSGSATYDTRGHVLTATDALGHGVTHTYDANGNQTATTYPLGHTQTFALDAVGNVLSRTDPRGGVVALEYDAFGNQSEMTDELGRVIQFGRDANGNLTSQADDLGFVQTIAYDANNHPTTLDVGGALRTVVYDQVGLPSQVTTASGSVAAIGYDALGQVTGLSDAGGASATQTFDAEGNVVATTDRVGNVTQYEYDAANRLRRTIHPNGSTEISTYDAAGQRLTMTDRGGHTTSFAYDAAGRLTTITDALGGVTTRTYDAVGNLLTETDPLLHVTSHVYDAENRLVETTFPGGTTVQRTYDAAGNLATVVDAAGHTTAFSYDLRDRLTTVTDALGKLTRYEYDDAARTSARIDANGNRTTFEYDQSGRVVETRYPGGDTEAASYDGAGRPVSQTNGNGETLEYVYDATGALVTIKLPGGAEETYSYTPDGLVATVTDARGTTTFDYQPLTRQPVRATEPDGRYVRYAYDGAGNRTLMADAAGPGQPEDVTTYTHDALNRLATITDPDGGVTTYDRDAAGNLTTVTLPNGAATEYAFDVQNRLTAVVHKDPASAVLASFAYTLDALGNRTVETHADGSRVEYDYDATARVTAERHYDSNGVLVDDATFVYDAAGNVTSRSGSLGSATFGYNARNQLTAGGGLTYGYDGAGNLVSATAGSAVTTYAYDARGRMTELQPPAGTATEYEYDFLGLRQRKSGPNGTVDFLTDRTSPTGFAQVLRESDATGTTLRSYAHGSKLLARFEGGVPSYHHADGLGSTRLLTNAAGATTDTFDYAAYGSVLARTGTSPDSYQFAGEPRDAESGLTYLRARYYDPSIGRFLARDPAGGDEKVPLSLNKYLYANANPVNLTDPSGRETLVSLNVSQSISAQQRRTEVLNFARNTRTVTKRFGVIYQYLGAIFTTIAAVEMIGERRPFKKFFGNLGLASTVAEPAVFAALELRLGMLSVSMFAKKAQYEFQTVIVNGAVLNLAPDDYAGAVRNYTPSDSAGIIVLGPKMAGSPPLPTSWGSIFGGQARASGMGIMVHEWSHLILKTVDDKYLCRRASLLPANVQLNNADNYRCLVEAYALLSAKDLVDDILGL